jgi:hypothetical protein
MTLHFSGISSHVKKRKRKKEKEKNWYSTGCLSYKLRVEFGLIQ